MISYFYILGTVLFTVYGQIVVKWRVMKYGAAPAELTPKILFLFHLIIDPYVISALVAAFAASLCWMLAMTKLDLSYAYPFVSGSFVLVMILSAAIFKEPLTVYKITGILFIIFGIVISSRSI